MLLQSKEQIEQLLQHVEGKNPTNPARSKLIHFMVNSKDQWVSTTQATECIAGTSGRGNPRYAEDVRNLHRAGLLEMRSKGRSQWFKSTPALIDWAKGQADYASVKEFKDRLDQYDEEYRRKLKNI